MSDPLSDKRTTERIGFLSRHTLQVRSRTLFTVVLPLIITVLVWGFNFVALKVLYEEVEPPAVALIRFGGMYVALLAVCVFKGESLRFPKEDALRLHWLGFISMGVYMLFFLEGMRGSAPAEAAILLNSAPILTMLLAAAMGQEQLRPGALGGATIAFVGVAMVVIAGAARGQSSLLGNLLILISAVVWAYCVVLMAPLLKRYSPLSVLTLSMPAGLLVLVPYGLRSAIQTDYTAVSPMGWLMFVHVSIISGVVAFLCFYQAVRRVGGAGAMLAMFFVPPTAALFAWWVLGRTLAPIQFVGLAVVIIGVSVAQRYRSRESAEKLAKQPPLEVTEGTI